MNNIGNAIREYLELIKCDAYTNNITYSVLLPYKYIGMSHNVCIYQLAIIRRLHPNMYNINGYRTAYSTSTGLVTPDIRRTWHCL